MNRVLEGPERRRLWQKFDIQAENSAAQKAPAAAINLTFYLIIFALLAVRNAKNAACPDFSPGKTRLLRRLPFLESMTRASRLQPPCH
jgi:hypothetical protein